MILSPRILISAAAGPRSRFVPQTVQDEVGPPWFSASLVPSLACRHLNILELTAFLQQEERNGFNPTLKEGLTRCRPVSWPDLMSAASIFSYSGPVACTPCGLRTTSTSQELLEASKAKEAVQDPEKAQGNPQYSGSNALCSENSEVTDSEHSLSS
ncbi:hypothetical protein B0H13DRAFT_1897143 [Mycena leptocephala]|nr:hypothetical protein B0H13DRAFT_1897143 [Mycena leptocephala]